MRQDSPQASWGGGFPPDHWTADYFSNPTLSGPPATTVDEGTGFVEHCWGDGSPAGLPTDNFCARFTRTITVAAGRIASPDVLLGDNRCLTERATAPQLFKVPISDEPVADGVRDTDGAAKCHETELLCNATYSLYDFSG